MRPTLVTGANGHVGNNICRLLAQRGDPVRAMMRDTADPAPLQGLDVEIVRGDILRPGGRAPRGGGLRSRVTTRLPASSCGRGIRSRRSSGRASTGTRNVMKAAAKAGVEKVLYVSTGGTIGCARTPERAAQRGRQQHGRAHSVLHRQDRRREGGVRHRRAREASPSRRSIPVSFWVHDSGSRASPPVRSRFPEQAACRSTSRAASAWSTSRTSPRGASSPWTRALPASATSSPART